MMHSYISIWGLILQTGYYIILGYYIIGFSLLGFYIIIHWDNGFRFNIHFYEIYYGIFMLSLIFK